MHFDPIITNPGRLTILTTLCRETRKDFVSLRRATQLTDGNLATHARRLESVGMVTIEKASRDGRAVTFITLTDDGRAALRRHVDTLESSFDHRPVLEQSASSTESVAASPVGVVEEEERWLD